MMNLTLQGDDGDVARVLCEGEISQIRFPADGNPLEDLLGEHCFSRSVLLNLAKAAWIDSSGISWLIVSHKRFLQAGGLLVLHSLPPRIAGVLQICQMDRIFSVARDEAAARARAQRKD